MYILYACAHLALRDPDEARGKAADDAAHECDGELEPGHARRDEQADRKGEHEDRVGGRGDDEREARPEEVEGRCRKQERGERIHHVERAVHVGAIVAEQGHGDAQHRRDGAVVAREGHAHEHKIVQRREPPTVPR